jgi:hypothetical protein
VNISRDSDSLKKGEQDTKVWKVFEILDWFGWV